MERYEHVPPRKITILSHAFDFDAMRPRLTPERRKQLRDEAGGNGRFLIGMVARLAIEKKHEVLLESVVEVRKRCPDAFFVIVGDGPRRGELERLATRLGVEQHVRFLGWRWDAWDLIESMNVIAHPSPREPFGIIYIEAMAFERAVVTTDDGAAPEIFEHGETALLVPPNDVKAFAGALIELATDPSRTASMGARGRERAIEKYAFPRLMPEYERYYERTLA
jgi:glycosyltransferase involved in cell wall biosynthesis